MAERRMFAKSIIDSDVFLEMPLTAQALYFHLGMRADDDGFIGNPKMIQRMTGCSDDDLKLLIAKNFIIPFDSGVVVIKHWKIHNYVRSDRYKGTVYLDEKAMLNMKNSKGYTICRSLGIPNDNQMETQVRLGKDRIGKYNKKEIYKEKEKPERKPSCRHKYGEYKNVLLSDEELEKLKAEFPSDWQDRIERLSEYMDSTGKSYKGHLATIRHWARREGTQTSQKNTGKWCSMDEPSPEEVLGIKGG